MKNNSQLIKQHLSVVKITVISIILIGLKQSGNLKNLNFAFLKWISDSSFFST